MARLVIHVDIDLDPTVEDPMEVAQELMWEFPGVAAFGVDGSIVQATWGGQ